MWIGLYRFVSLITYCALLPSDSLKLPIPGELLDFIFIDTLPSFSSSPILISLSITFITQVLSLTSCCVYRLSASSPAMAAQNDAVTAMTNRSIRTIQSVSTPPQSFNYPPHILQHLLGRENEEGVYTNCNRNWTSLESYQSSPLSNYRRSSPNSLVRLNSGLFLHNQHSQRQQRLRPGTGVPTLHPRINSLLPA